MRSTQLTSFSRTLVLGVFALAQIALQAQAEVLVPGNPPLTSDTVHKVTGFFEWALDLHFTPAEAQEQEQMLLADWANPAKRKSTLELVQTIDKAAKVSPETRNRVQGEVRRVLLEGMRKQKDDPESRWMLALYERAHPASGETAPSTLNVSAPTAEARRIVGKWRATHAAAVQYQNSYTGALAPTSGNSFAYEFLPDGTYQFNGLMQITTYGCTSSVYDVHSGRYRVQGDRLYIELMQGNTKSHVCGGQPKEKPDTLETRTYVFHLETSGTGETLVVNGVDGKTRPDYFRREK